jgi:hypothetical protein
LILSHHRYKPLQVIFGFYRLAGGINDMPIGGEVSCGRVWGLLGSTTDDGHGRVYGKALANDSAKFNGGLGQPLRSSTNANLTARKKLFCSHKWRLRQALFRLYLTRLLARRLK